MSTPEQREKWRLAKAARRSKFPDRALEQQRCYARAWRARKRVENPEYMKTLYEDPAKRRARRDGKLSDPSSGPVLREKERRAGLRRNYGISLENYTRMVEKAGGVCEICHQPETAVYRKNGRETMKFLTVDHDHETGRIRGILCHRCNAGLGSFRDSSDILHNAARYLKEHDSNA